MPRPAARRRQRRQPHRAEPAARDLAQHEEHARPLARLVRGDPAGELQERPVEELAARRRVQGRRLDAPQVEPRLHVVGEGVLDPQGGAPAAGGRRRATRRVAQRGGRAGSGQATGQARHSVSARAAQARGARARRRARPRQARHRLAREQAAEHPAVGRVDRGHGATSGPADRHRRPAQLAPASAARRDELGGVGRPPAHARHRERRREREGRERRGRGHREEREREGRARPAAARGALAPRAGGAARGPRSAPRARRPPPTRRGRPG